MSKRSFVGVAERPIYKDWALWHAIGWALAVGISTAVDPLEDSTSPLWIDVIGVTVVTFFFVGWTVSLIRWLVRTMRRKFDDRHVNENSAQPVARPVQDPHTFPPTAQSPVPSPATEPAPVTSASPAPQPETRPVTSPPPSPPVSLTSFAGADFRTSAALLTARQELPYPIARAVRAVQSTPDPLEQYQAVLDLGEHLTFTTGMLAAAWLRAHAPQDPALSTLHSAFVLRGVSQGHWHDVIRAAEKHMATSEFAIAGFVEGVRMAKGRKGLLPDLQVLLEERNRSAHGARPHNRAEAAVRTSHLLEPAENAVRAAGFMALSSWVLVESVALRRDDKRWSIRVRTAMGDHPEFETITITRDHALANDTFYVLTEPEALDLTPMLVMRYCDQCRQPEVCYADRLDPSAGVSLKSFARGHQVFDAGLVPEVHTLVGRPPAQSS